MWCAWATLSSRLDDEDKDKKRPGEVELPPLLMRDGGNSNNSNNIAGAGTSQRSVSPPD